MSTVGGRSPWLAGVVAATFCLRPGIAGYPDTRVTTVQQKRMSYHNRVLLNHAAILQLPQLQVMLALEPGQGAAVESVVARAGGRVIRSYADIGYLRVELPIERVISVLDDPGVAAYQIASLSKAGWMRDAYPQVNAETFRGFWRSPVVGNVAEQPKRERPLLTVEQSRATGYTADIDAGVGEWLTRHPTFDGRGVTIAVLGQGLPDFSDPIFEAGRTVAGTEVPKLVGVMNAIGADDADESRIRLDRVVTTAGTWVLIDNQPYTMPHPGRFRFGLFSLPAGGNLTHRFGVVEDLSSHELRVDTDGDSDFQDETVISDVNTRFDVRKLTLTAPVPSRLAFVLARSQLAGVVHLYVGRGVHDTMVMSVAAGTRTSGSLAYGVAPAARVLMVRAYGIDFRLHTFIEAYLEAAARPDVDILVDATGVDIAPDTAADFLGLIFDRIATRYGKPLFHAADNLHQWLGNVSARGGSFAVGGSLGPETFAALFGGAPLPRMMVHHASAAGPAIDGRLKPDFLAPMHRIAAGGSATARSVLLPKNHPALQLPPHYQISCCTSASAPYAAGVAALLVSAARQSNLLVGRDHLARALRAGARFLADVPAYQQGSGVLDVGGAWRELNRRVDIPRIRTSAHVVHPMATYAARGAIGEGIFELEGWTAGASGVRDIRFVRESGPAAPVAYRVTWSGNDGTFSAATTLALGLNTSVVLPVTIAVRAPGAHSAILNLHDPLTDAIVFRGMTTIVAAAAADPVSHTVRFSATLPLMRKSAHFLTVPDAVGSAVVELEVTHGAVSVAVAPNYGLVPYEYHHLLPQIGRTFLTGKYTAVIPQPRAGTWMMDVGNASARMERDQTLVRTSSAEYTLTVRFIGVELQVTPHNGRLTIDVDNRGAALHAPMLQAATAALTSHFAAYRSSGLPTLFPIDVPAGTTTLMLSARSDSPEAAMLEAHLYDCSSGECFSHDFTLPAASTQKLLVRHPAAGRWLAAINPAPFPVARGGFALDVLVAGAIGRQAPPTRTVRFPGARWSDTVAEPLAAADGSVVLIELVDDEVDRQQVQQKWETRPAMPDFRVIPAPLGSVIRALPARGKTVR